MATESELRKQADKGKLAFQAKQYEAAIAEFQAAAQGYASLNAPLDAAEMRNNLSVALLQSGRAREALEAAQGTDEVFAQAGDARRQGMAVGNQAAALESLGRKDEALAAYERSAQLFADAGEGDLRSMVLKSAAALKLKRGRITDSAFNMIGSLEAREKPSVFERILKSLLRFIQR